jgi:hypothetical protein
MPHMLKTRVSTALFALALLTAITASAQQMVPLKGHWSGVTVSADPTNFPVVSIVAAGGGHLSHLGNFTMYSPHTTNVFTGETLGFQYLTAANGDTLTAYCAGFPLPQPPDFTVVVGTLDCTITGGTGRFEGATGSYDFAIVARPRTDGPGYATEAEITGSISTVGGRF